MTWVAWLGVLYNPIGPIRRIVTVAEKHRGSQDSRTAFSYISRIIISQQFRYFLTCLYFQCYRIKMSAQTKVEVTRGVFDPRTYKQVKMDYNFSWQKGTNFFLMGNCVKGLSSCGQLMWWWKSGTMREFAQINHPKWAMSEISIWYLKHSKYHIVNQKMTTFEMFMKNEATCERLLRFCISGLAEILMKNTKYSNCQIAWFFLEQSQCILYIHCTHRRSTMF